jgi:hypothetical protein
MEEMSDGGCLHLEMKGRESLLERSVKNRTRERVVDLLESTCLMHAVRGGKQGLFGQSLRFSPYNSKTSMETFFNL